MTKPLNSAQATLNSLARTLLPNPIANALLPNDDNNNEKSSSSKVSSTAKKVDNTGKKTLNSFEQLLTIFNKSIYSHFKTDGVLNAKSLLIKKQKFSFKDVRNIATVTATYLNYAKEYEKSLTTTDDYVKHAQEVKSDIALLESYNEIFNIQPKEIINTLIEKLSSQESIEEVIPSLERIIAESKESFPKFPFEKESLEILERFCQNLNKSEIEEDVKETERQVVLGIMQTALKRFPKNEEPSVPSSLVVDTLLGLSDEVLEHKAGIILNTLKKEIPIVVANLTAGQSNALVLKARDALLSLCQVLDSNSSQEEKQKALSAVKTAFQPLFHMRDPSSIFEETDYNWREILVLGYQKKSGRKILGLKDQLKNIGIEISNSNTSKDTSDLRQVLKKIDIEIELQSQNNLVKKIENLRKTVSNITETVNNLPETVEKTTKKIEDARKVVDPLLKETIGPLVQTTLTPFMQEVTKTSGNVKAIVKNKAISALLESTTQKKDSSSKDPQPLEERIANLVPVLNSTKDALKDGINPTLTTINQGINSEGGRKILQIVADSSKTTENNGNNSSSFVANVNAVTELAKAVHPALGPTTTLFKEAVIPLANSANQFLNSDTGKTVVSHLTKPADKTVLRNHIHSIDGVSANNSSSTFESKAKAVADVFKEGAPFLTALTPNLKELNEILGKDATKSLVGVMEELSGIVKPFVTGNGDGSLIPPNPETGKKMSGLLRSVFSTILGSMSEGMSGFVAKKLAQCGLWALDKVGPHIPVFGQGAYQAVCSQLKRAEESGKFEDIKQALVMAYNSINEFGLTIGGQPVNLSVRQGVLPAHQEFRNIDRVEQPKLAYGDLYIPEKKTAIDLIQADAPMQAAQLLEGVEKRDYRPLIRRANEDKKNAKSILRKEFFRFIDHSKTSFATKLLAKGIYHATSWLGSSAIENTINKADEIFSNYIKDNEKYNFGGLRNLFIANLKDAVSIYSRSFDAVAAQTRATGSPETMLFEILKQRESNKGFSQEELDKKFISDLVDILFPKLNRSGAMMNGIAKIKNDVGRNILYGLAFVPYVLLVVLELIFNAIAKAVIKKIVSNSGAIDTLFKKGGAVLKDHNGFSYALYETGIELLQELIDEVQTRDFSKQESLDGISQARIQDLSGVVAEVFKIVDKSQHLTLDDLANALRPQNRASTFFQSIYDQFHKGMAPRIVDGAARSLAIAFDKFMHKDQLEKMRYNVFRLFNKTYATDEVKTPQQMQRIEEQFSSLMNTLIHTIMEKELDQELSAAKMRRETDKVVYALDETVDKYLKTVYKPNNTLDQIIEATNDFESDLNVLYNSAHGNKALLNTFVNTLHEHLNAFIRNTLIPMKIDLGNLRRQNAHPQYALNYIRYNDIQYMTHIFKERLEHLFINIKLGEQVIRERVAPVLRDYVTKYAHGAVDIGRKIDTLRFFTNHLVMLPFIKGQFADTVVIPKANPSVIKV